MTTYKSTIISLSAALEQEQKDSQSPCYKLRWRQRQLLVSLEQSAKQPFLPLLDSEQRLFECLKHSPVNLVSIDANLGEERLKLWIDACEKANKAVFLRLPPTLRLPKQHGSLSWWLKWLLNWSLAALLVLVLSPVIVGFICLLRIQSPEPIFLQQWCVGERGKLFRLYTFRPIGVNAKTLENDLMSLSKKISKRQDSTLMRSLSSWIRKSKLNELPQLFNVLRGEMRLLEPRPLTLKQAIRLSKEERQKINTLSRMQRA